MASAAERDTLGLAREVTGTVAVDAGSRGAVEYMDARRAQWVTDPEVRRVLEQVLIVLTEIKDTIRNGGA